MLERETHAASRDGLRLLETRNANGSLKARFTHGLARIEGIGSCVEVYRASDAKRFYMLYDHRGSAHVLLDESKAVVATRLHNAFGETVSETGTWPDEVPFGYQTNWLALDGMTLPDGTRLYLSPTRVYHPGVGRFLQRDPLALLTAEDERRRVKLSSNLFVYARDVPTRFVDPSGLTVMEMWHKYRNGKFRHAVGMGINSTLATLIGGVAAGTNVMFFPDTCEVAVFYQYSQNLIYTGGDAPTGGQAGVAATVEVAFYAGQGKASAQSYAGDFAGIAGNVGLVAGSIYWGQGWCGGSIGVGVGTPVGGNTNPMNYYLKDKWEVPYPVCLMMICAKPGVDESSIPMLQDYNPQAGSTPCTNEPILPATWAVGSEAWLQTHGVQPEPFQPGWIDPRPQLIPRCRR
ncbi:MAG: RHS repeat domain-containing protein [Planctomycetota bacterium]|jgi:RHS repeat-associated protein